MKPAERDELLIRVDERLKQLKDGDEGDIPEIKKHLKTLNSKVQSHDRTLVRIKTTGSIAGFIVAGLLGWLGKIKGLW